MYTSIFSDFDQNGQWNTNVIEYPGSQECRTTVCQNSLAQSSSGLKIKKVQLEYWVGYVHDPMIIALNDSI